MSESRVMKAQKNAVTSILSNLVNVVVTFISRVIFVYFLNAEYLGINGLFANILSILSLAELGMGTAMMYRLYKPIAEHDEEKILSLINFFRKVYLCIAGGVLIIGLILIPFLKLIIKLDHEVPYINGYYVLALLNVVISYLFVYRTTLVSADQKNYILNKYIILFKVLTLVVQSVVLVIFRNYFLYLAAALVISFISNLYQNHIAIKLYPYLRKKAGKLSREEKHNIFEDVKALFLYRFSGTIQTNTDSILISLFLGTVFVGYYSNYTMVVLEITVILGVIFNSVKSSVGNLVVSNDSTLEQKYFYFKVLELINFWIVGFSSICFINLFQGFITLAFGSDYLLSIATVIFITLNFYTSNIRQAIWTFRETTGLFHQTKYVTAVTAGLNIVISPIMGYFWGIAGIILATVCSRMLYAWWKEPMILYQQYFKKGTSIYIITYLKRLFLCAAACGFTYLICHLLPEMNLYMRLVIQLGTCILVPNIIFLIVFVRTPEFGYIRERVIEPFMRRCNWKLQKEG